MAGLILIVDDDPDLRQMLRHLFESDGYDVIEAADGDTAWDLVSVRRPAILVTDLQMRGFDGFALARRLRESEFARMGIIVYTGQPVTGDEARRAGADELVLKTEPISRLREVVERLQRNEREGPLVDPLE